jgi:hypothetical protein
MQESAVARAKAKATYTSRRALPASSGFREFVAFESLGARWSARGAGPDTTGARGPTEDRPGRRRKQLTGLRRRRREWNLDGPGNAAAGKPGHRRQPVQTQRAERRRNNLREPLTAVVPPRIEQAGAAESRRRGRRGPTRTGLGEGENIYAPQSSRVEGTRRPETPQEVSLDSAVAG